MTRKWRMMVLALLTVVWLVPLLAARGLGVSLRLRHPRLIFQHSGTGLFFTIRNPSWTQIVLQTKRTPDGEWRSESTKALSPMGAFGYRQRLDRILQEIHGCPVADEVRQRLATWLAGRSEQQLGGETTAAVRFGAVVWAANSPELARPAGHWVSDSETGSPMVPPTPFSSYAISGGKARLTVTPPHSQASTPKTPVSRVPPVFRRKQPGMDVPAPNSGGSDQPAAPANLKPRIQ